MSETVERVLFDEGKSVIFGFLIDLGRVELFVSGASDEDSLALRAFCDEHQLLVILFVVLSLLPWIHERESVHR